MNIPEVICFPASCHIFVPVPFMLLDVWAHLAFNLWNLTSCPGLCGRS
uniref:Uncharacterized protein n=1 Tax=Anguilla anguilla TaxID=7936 RepID=A0A0E9TC86_ANGAN